MKPVIICGGIGTKMWPMSRPETPKHFLPLIDGKSLFEITWESLRKNLRPKIYFYRLTGTGKNCPKTGSGNSG